MTHTNRRLEHMWRFSPVQVMWCYATLNSFGKIGLGMLVDEIPGMFMSLFVRKERNVVFGGEILHVELSEGM